MRLISDRALRRPAKGICARRFRIASMRAAGDVPGPQRCRANVGADRREGDATRRMQLCLDCRAEAYRSPMKWRATEFAAGCFYRAQARRARRGRARDGCRCERWNCGIQPLDCPSPWHSSGSRAGGLRREEIEIERRERAYRDGHLPMRLEGRTAILVDDGLATGATMFAAARALRPKSGAGHRCRARRRREHMQPATR